MNASEILESCKTHFNERLVSPLFGAFAASWCVINYRFLMVLVSSLDFHAKLKYIDEVLYPTWSTTVLMRVVYPLAATVFIIFVYPFPARYTFWFWRNQNRKLNAVRQQIDQETLLTRDESRKLKSQIFDAQTKFDQELAQKDVLIGEWKRKFEESDKIHAEFAGTLRRELEMEPVETIAPEALDVLRVLASSGSRMQEQKVVNDLKWPAVKVQHLLDKLEKANWVTGNRDPAGTMGYELTPTGREVAIHRKLV